MNENPGNLKGFFETEFYRQKEKQTKCKSHKELLEWRIRFLKKLLDVMNEIQNDLIDISQMNGEPSSIQSQISQSNGDGGEGKLVNSIDRLCACQELIKKEVNELSEVLNVIIMEYEHASEEIEETSKIIRKIQNETKTDLAEILQ